MESLGKVEDETNRECDHQDSTGDTNFLLVLTKSLDALSDPATGESEHEQGQSCTDGECDREHDCLGADASCRTGNRNGGQDWSSTRYVHGAEGEAEHEATAVSSDILLRNPRERLLQNVLEGRND